MTITNPFNCMLASVMELYTAPHTRFDAPPRAPHPTSTISRPALRSDLERIASFAVHRNPWPPISEWWTVGAPPANALYVRAHRLSVTSGEMLEIVSPDLYLNDLLSPVPVVLLSHKHIDAGHFTNPPSQWLPPPSTSRDYLSMTTQLPQSTPV